MKRELLSFICCPRCRGALTTPDTRKILNDGVLTCASCTTTYPLRDGIPVLLADEKLRRAKKTRRNWEAWWSRVRTGDDAAQYEALWTRAEKNLGGEPLLRAKDFTGKVVLDAGCGTGRLIASDFSKAKCEAIIALDLGEQVFAAQRRYGRLANTHFIQGDLTNPPLKDGAVDVIVSHGVLHHTPRPRDTFHELTRVLKNNGLFALYVYHKEWAYFTTHRKSLLLDALYAGGVLIWQTIRAVTSRLPHTFILAFAWLMACKASVEATLEKCRVTAWLGAGLRLVPPFAYLGVDFHERLVRNYDHYSATYNYFFTIDEVVDWFANEGYDDVEIASVPVSIRARKTGRKTGTPLHVTQFHTLQHFQFREEWERLHTRLETNKQ